MADTKHKLQEISQGTAIGTCPQHGIHVGHVFDIDQLADFIEAEKEEARAAKPDISITIKTEVTMKGAPKA